jgi:hypothetical protein
VVTGRTGALQAPSYWPDCTAPGAGVGPWNKKRVTGPRTRQWLGLDRTALCRESLRSNPGWPIVKPKAKRTSARVTPVSPTKGTQECTRPDRPLQGLTLRASGPMRRSGCRIATPRPARNPAKGPPIELSVSRARNPNQLQGAKRPRPSNRGTGMARKGLEVAGQGGYSRFRNPKRQRGHMARVNTRLSVVKSVPRCYMPLRGIKTMPRGHF